MASLIIKSPEGERTHELVDDVTTLGRASTNIIQLKDEQSSRQHCRIERSGDSFMLVDLGSRNGTKVNGTRVSQQTLKVGDEVVVGDYRIIFDAPQQVTAEELGATVEVDTVEDKVSAAEAARVSPPEKAMYVIEITEGPERGKTVELGADPVTMGRHSSNPLCLSDDAASNYHAEITREAIGYVITDLGSTNGTKVNGERIVKTALSDGATIEIGQSRLVLRNLGKATEEDQVFGTVVLDTEKLERELLDDEAHSRKALVIFLLGAAVVLLVLGGAGWGLVSLARALGRGGDGIAGNLLRNYSFEGETDESGAPKGWRWQSNPNLLWEVDRDADRLADAKEKGALSLTRRAQAPADAFTFCEHLEDIPVELGTGYRLGGSVRGEGATGVYGFRVTWLGARGRTDYDLAAAYGPQNVWRELARVLDPPSWSTHAKLWCFACGNHGRIFFDDVYLVPAEKPREGREALRVSGGDLTAEFNSRGIAWVRFSGANVVNEVELYVKSAEQGSPEALQGLGRVSGLGEVGGTLSFDVDIVDFGTLVEFHLMERASATRGGVGVDYTLTCPMGSVRAREVGLRLSVAESFAESEPVLHKGEGGATEEVVFISPEGERFAIHVPSGAREVRTEPGSGSWLVELALAKRTRIRRVPLAYRVEFNPFSVFERRRIDEAWKEAEDARKGERMADLLRALEKLAGMEEFPEDAAKARTETAALRKTAEDDVAGASRKVEAYIGAGGKSLREKTLAEAEATLERMRVKWAGTEFDARFSELEMKAAEHTDALARREREEKAEKLRQRILRLWDAKSYPMVLAFGKKLLEDFPDTEAARKLKDSGLLEQAARLFQEDEAAQRALERLKARLRNLVANRLYKEAFAQAMQSPEHKQFGSHRLFREYMDELRAKTGLE